MIASLKPPASARPARPCPGTVGRMPTDRPRSPRTSAEALRARSDESLVGLLQARPDLAVPPPVDLGSLAARAATRASVRQVLDGLTTAHLQVLEVLAVLPEPCTAAAVTRTWGAPAGTLLDELSELALVWGTPRALHLLRTVREMLGAHPAGLGPPLAEALDRRSPARLQSLLADLGLPPAPDPPRAAAALAAHLGEPAVLEALLTTAPEGTRDLLARLTWGPPVGAVADADREVRRAGGPPERDQDGDVRDWTPVDWLLAHGVLAVADPGHVVLPREIGLALRGGRVHREPRPAPEPLPTDGVDEARVVPLAAHTAAEAVRLVGELCQAWSEGPPGVLRSGGVGVRDLRRAAQLLDVEPRLVALLAEVAGAAGLVADDGEADPRFAPTPAYDAWLAGSTGERWAWLVEAWLDSPAAPHLVGSRDAREGVVAALSPASRRPGAASLRRWVLGELAVACPPGRAAAGAAGGVTDAAEAVGRRLSWARPRRAGDEAAMIAAVLEEAGQLGVLALGAPVPALREPLAAAAGDDPLRAPAPNRPDEWWDAAASALDAALPPPVDHLLLQADLTAIAPGPLVADLQRVMDTLADVDSRGGATVYRFSASSVRRGLDLGMTAEEILSLLRGASRTGVPQPLEYLVADVARRHGTIRVGAAAAFVRSDDVSALDELLADRRAARLRLRRLAPTVACSPATPDEVLTVLRAVGLAPSAEGPGGQVLLARPGGHRSPGAASRPRRVAGRDPAAGPPRPSPEGLLRMVRAVRAAEDVTGETTRRRVTGASMRTDAGPDEEPDDAVGGDPERIVATLRLAADRRVKVRVRLVDPDGRGASLVLEPLGVDAGLLTALDVGSGRIRSYPLHRLRSVAAAPATTR